MLRGPATGRPGAAAGVDLEVQVRAGHVAGRAGVADDVAGADLVAGLDAEAALVAVPDVGAVVSGMTVRLP